MGDIPTMQRWEILRRSQRACTASEVAAESRASLEDVQRSLDMLVEARLVVRIPAKSRRRAITYRAAVERLVLRWDRERPEDVAAFRAMVLFMRSYSRRVHDEATYCLDADEFISSNLEGATSVMLLDEDAKKIRDAISSAYAMLASADQRARAADNASQAKPFHVSFALIRLREPELPMAELFSAETRSYRSLRQQVESTASRILSPREFEVAQLLAKGRTRPEIAKELELTVNTVGTVSKLIYRKLGVTTRAALVLRMRLG